MFDLENNEMPHKRWIYLLPNLFTTAALFAGFYSIVAAMKGDFEIASNDSFYSNDYGFPRWSCCSSYWHSE